MIKKPISPFPQIVGKVNLKDIGDIFFGDEPCTFVEGNDPRLLPQSLSGLVPITRVLTINGVSFNLSSDRTWNVGTVTSIGTTGLISGGTITGAGTITTSMNTNKLVGRGSAGVGIMEEITLGTNLSLSGTTLNAASPSGAALTKTDDTNVTLTLGGSPTTSLLAATSLTLGWTGKLALSRFVQGTTGTVLQGITSSDSIYTSSPTISTSVTTPLIIGGTGTGSDLILQSTSGVGDDTSWIIHKVANNGNVETMREGVALSPDASATGGTITTSGGYTIHTFTSGGTFTVLGGTLSVDYLIVAGGGGGGAGNGGGGGAGGLLSGSALSCPVGAYTITIGSGGSGGTNAAPAGVSGGNSTALGFTASGGGGGGYYSAVAGLNGGSGGGGGPSTASGGTGTGGQGNNGGTGQTAGNYRGGGGGGAGAAGATGAASGNGGIGTSSSISGSATYYAGGGGGGSQLVGSNSSGGNGGGGAGVDGIAGQAGTNATANTGGGGGGSAGYSGTRGNGGNGGSGIVIIRYLTPSTTKRPVIGINKSAPTAQLHIGAGAGNQYSGQLQFDPGIVLAAPVAGTIEYVSTSNDDLWFTINTGTARKGFIFNDGSNLTSGKIPIASTNGRLIDGQTPLSGTKVYYVADSSGGAVTRKLTFINGILTSET